MVWIFYQYKDYFYFLLTLNFIYPAFDIGTFDFFSLTFTYNFSLPLFPPLMYTLDCNSDFLNCRCLDLIFIPRCCSSITKLKCDFEIKFLEKLH